LNSDSRQKNTNKVFKTGVCKNRYFDIALKISESYPSR
jgi:hypothetical protein